MPTAVKAFGVSLLVEVLAGVMTGAGVAQGVGSMFAENGQPANVGHLFLAVDPQRFDGAGSFLERFAALAEGIRAAQNRRSRGVRAPARRSALGRV